MLAVNVCLELRSEIKKAIKIIFSIISPDIDMEWRRPLNC